VTGLDRALEGVAAAPSLLVASDFDGTLSPIVDDPARAAPFEPALRALRTLAELPDTHVAVVSGRALADLRGRADVPDHVHLIGGHGVEIGSLPDAGLSPMQATLRGRILHSLRNIAHSAPGFVVEEKPASIAFHYRNAEPAAAEAAILRVRSLADRPGVVVREGKKVIELGVTEGDKGVAIRRLADSLSVDAVVYIGDDVTDEDAFAVLRSGDLGIKVGPGITLARFRVEDPAAVAGLLERLYAARAAAPR
jgi:trehalose 6-phosphate phosphatase